MDSNKKSLTLANIFGKREGEEITETPPRKKQKTKHEVEQEKEKYGDWEDYENLIAIRDKNKYIDSKGEAKNWINYYFSIDGDKNEENKEDKENDEEEENSLPFAIEDAFEDFQYPEYSKKKIFDKEDFLKARFEFTEMFYRNLKKRTHPDDYDEDEQLLVLNQIYENTRFVLWNTSLDEKQQELLLNNICVKWCKTCSYDFRNTSSNVHIYSHDQAKFLEVDYAFHNRCRVWAGGEFSFTFTIRISTQKRKIKIASNYVDCVEHTLDHKDSNGHYESKDFEIVVTYPKFGLKPSQMKSIRNALFSKKSNIGKKMTDIQILHYIVAASGGVLKDNCDHSTDCSKCLGIEPRYGYDWCDNNLRCKEPQCRYRKYKNPSPTTRYGNNDRSGIEYLIKCRLCEKNGYVEWPADGLETYWGRGDVVGSRFFENELRIVSNSVRDVDKKLYTHTDFKTAPEEYIKKKKEEHTKKFRKEYCSDYTSEEEIVTPVFKKDITDPQTGEIDMEKFGDLILNVLKAGRNRMIRTSALKKKLKRRMVSQHPIAEKVRLFYCIAEEEFFSDNDIVNAISHLEIQESIRCDNKSAADPMIVHMR